MGLDDVKPHPVKQLVLDRQAGAGQEIALLFIEQVFAARRTAQLEVGMVPLSDVPLMAMEVRPVSPLTSGKLPVSGVLLMVMLRRLVGGAANAVKPAPFT